MERAGAADDGADDGEHVQGDEPQIAMPALTLDALRQAVAAVVPSRLPR